MPDVPVVKVEAISPKPEKVPASIGVSSEWRIRLRYTLVDGRTVEGTDRFSLKRRAMARLAEMPQAPRPGAMAACFDEAGECYAIVSSPFAPVLPAEERT